MIPVLIRYYLRHVSLVIVFSLLNLSLLAQKVSISNATVTEGQNLQFAVSLDKAVAGGFTVDLLLNSTGAEADGVDFNPSQKSITFSGTPETQTLIVTTADDQISEGNETFTVALATSKLGVDVSATGIGTIVDNDVAHVTIQDATATEGDNLVFRMKLDRQVKSPFTVGLVFTDGTAVKNIATNKRKEAGDYDASAQFVVFEGKPDEEHSIKVKSLVDFNPSEGMESFAVALTSDPAQSNIDVSSKAKGFISDFSDCLNCPSRLFLDTVKQLDLTFFGDGNLQKTVQSEDEIAATTGIGVHVNKYFKHLPQQRFGLWYRAELMAQINIASTVDTITAEVKNVNGTEVIDNLSSFGNSVLTPLNSGQAIDLKLRLFNKKTIGGLISGFEVRYIGSNRVWQIKYKDDSLNLDLAEQVNTNLARIIAFHDFIPYHLRDNYSVMLRFGYAANWIRGDLGAKDREKIREKFVGTNRRTFHGVELGIGFRLRNILADFAYTILPSSTNVPGLTGSRLVMTIKFVGGFKISLDKE